MEILDVLRIRIMQFYPLDELACPLKIEPAALLTKAFPGPFVEDKVKINLPGTVFEHPNWRRKLSCELQELTADAAVRALAKTLRRLRPDGRPLGPATGPSRGEGRELRGASGPSTA